MVNKPHQNTLRPTLEYSTPFSQEKQFSYTSLYGYFAGSFLTTYLAVLIIFPARKTYFNRNVLICCLYSDMWRESNLNNKNRAWFKFD